MTKNDFFRGEKWKNTVFKIYFENYWFKKKKSNDKVNRGDKWKLFCVFTFYARPVDKPQYQYFSPLGAPR